MCDKRIGKVSSLESIRRNDVILGKQIGTFSLSALNKRVRKKRGYQSPMIILIKLEMLKEEQFMLQLVE